MRAIAVAGIGAHTGAVFSLRDNGDTDSLLAAAVHHRSALGGTMQMYRARARVNENRVVSLMR